MGWLLAVVCSVFDVGAFWGVIEGGRDHVGLGGE